MVLDDQPVTETWRLLDTGPRSAAAHLGRAEASAALCRFDRAVEDLELCLAMNEKDVTPEVRAAATKLLERCKRMLDDGAPPR